MLGVLCQGRADGKEAERQHREDEDLRGIDEDAGSEDIGGEQAADRRVERRISGEESADAVARTFSGFGAEGGANGEGAEQQAWRGDEDVVEDCGRQLVAAEQCQVNG
jgi:hypothetical protein